MSSNAPGNEQYIPTRLEWLSVQLNILFQVDNSEGRYSLFYQADNLNGKSINIVVIENKNANEKLIQREIEQAEKVISTFKDREGWEWLEWDVVREQATI